MILTLIIASRGNPEQLKHVITECDRRIHDHAQTRISIALDDDDDSNPKPPPTHSELVWSIAPREDSLGAKYNRAQRNAPAGAYVLGADDNIFVTDGWDELLRQKLTLFPENYAYTYFGRLDGSLPTQMAIPHALVETQGRLFPEYFPVWWYDNWVDEIANMGDRVVWAGIDVEEIGGRGKTRGLQDVSFWTNVYEALRPEREQIADLLIERLEPPHRALQLRQTGRRNGLKQFFTWRNERLRNPATAVHFEKRMSFDAAPEERYLRLKAKAEAFLQAQIAA